jgi:iron complex outermembrane receptor protein
MTDVHNQTIGSRSAVECGKTGNPLIRGAVAAAIAMVMLAPLSASSAGSEGGVLEEVVVTGTKRARAEELQKTPIPVTVVTDDMLRERNIVDLTQLSGMVPNAKLGETVSYPGIQRFWIRGTGTNFSVPNFDPAVAVYQDGVFVAQNMAAILDAFDMASIEVFRGPQGTLFGRNSSSGAISTRSRRPGDKLEIRADATLGSFGRRDLNASVGGPVTDTLGLKLAVLDRSDDGWLKNTFDGSTIGAMDRRLIRGTAVWKPTERLEITAIGERLRRTGDGGWSVSQGLCDLRPCTTTGLPARGWDETWDNSVPYESNTDQTVNKGVLEVNYTLSSGVITSVTGYMDLEGWGGGQFDGVPARITETIQMQKQHQFSEELRFASTFSGVFNFTVGGFYFDQEVEYGEMRAAGSSVGVRRPGVVDPLNPYGLTGPGYSTLSHTSKGVFLETHWQPWEKVSLTAGLRQSEESKSSSIGIVGFGSCNSFQQPPFYYRDEFSCTRGAKNGFDIVDSEDWSDLSWKFAAQYQFTDDIMAYYSVTRGYRSGGFSMRVAAAELTAAGVRPSFYDGERVDQQEVGLKAEWFDGRARTNLTAFYQNWRDIQRTIQQGVAVQKTANVKDSHVKGVELEANLILAKSMMADGDSLRLDLAGGKIWTGYDSPYIVGTANLQSQDFAVPHETGSVAFAYELPVGADSAKMSFRVALDYMGPWITEGPIRPTLIGRYRAKRLMDASIGYSSADGDWSVNVFGKNLLDDQYFETAVPFSDTSGVGWPGAPRSYGVTLSYRY